MINFYWNRIMKIQMLKAWLWIVFAKSKWLNLMKGHTTQHVLRRYESALHQKHKFQQDEQPDQLKILFCSRTHSQLTQLIEELRKTQYAVTSLSSAAIRVAPLASRKQLCINSTVLKHQNVQRINDECLDLQKSKCWLHLRQLSINDADWC